MGQVRPRRCPDEDLLEDEDLLNNLQPPSLEDTMEEAMSHEALAREVFGEGAPEGRSESTAMNPNPFEETAREAFGDDAGQGQGRGEDRAPLHLKTKSLPGQDQPAGEGPATDTDLAQVELPPAIKEVAHDPQVAQELGQFRQAAKEMGLSKRQAAGVLAKFTEHNARQEAAARSAGEAEMRSSWGSDYPAKVTAAKTAIRDLEREIPGLRRLAQGPAGNSRAFAELLIRAHQGR